MSFIGPPRYDLPSHLWPRPKYRGVLHTVGAFAVVPLGIWLVVSARGGEARLAAGVYIAAQLAVFATSALYHRVAETPIVRRRMQLADHSMIYVLIAGTWVPVCVVVLPDRWGIPFLVAIGLAAVVGILLKTLGIDRFPRLANTIYGVMGGAAVLALPALIDNIELLALGLMALGGVAYTVGAVIFMRKHPDPRPKIFGYHEVFHACTLIAAACHFGMVAIIVS